MAGKKGMKKSLKTYDKVKKQFFEKCLIVHGDKYDYSETEYVSSRDKVKIRCIKHDSYFWQLPSAHIQGQNCPECGKESNSVNSRLSDIEYKSRFDLVNQNQNVSYVEGSFTQMHSYCKFLCKIHGYTERSANNSLKTPETVCRKCKQELDRVKKQEIFVKKASLLHNYVFDYSKVYYTKNNRNVTLQCPLHGDFETTPNKHLDGRVGCLECARLKWGRWSPKVLEKNLDYFLNEDCCVYFLKMQISGQEPFYKCGITTDKVTRFQMLSKESGADLELVYHVWKNTYRCSELEHIFAEKYRKNRFKHGVYFGGYTECYSFTDEELKQVERFFNEAALE